MRSLIYMVVGTVGGVLVMIVAFIVGIWLIQLICDMLQPLLGG